jgi:hypothetical protein
MSTPIAITTKLTSLTRDSAALTRPVATCFWSVRIAFPTLFPRLLSGSATLRNLDSHDMHPFPITTR